MSSYATNSMTESLWHNALIRCASSRTVTSSSVPML